MSGMPATPRWAMRSPACSKPPARPVEREYYFNDAGRQMDLFGASVVARYLEVLGRDAELPEDGYHGEYVVEVARDIVARARRRPSPICPNPSARPGCSPRAPVGSSPGWSAPSSGSACGSTSTSPRPSSSARARSRRRWSGCAPPDYAYDADGATWFRSTAFGDDKDRVIVRSNGTHTYFGADCAYIVDKFARGFDHVVYVWGADHHGDVARMKGAASAMGYDRTRSRSCCTSSCPSSAAASP